LPRPVLDEDGNEMDLREELVKHLLEYKKYKSVIQKLADMEDSRLQKEKRGNLHKEIKTLAASSNVEAELQDIDLYRLMRTFEKVMLRFETEKNKPVHQVVQYPYTIATQKTVLLELLSKEKKMSFEKIIEQERNKIAVIFNFLAILELLQLKLIKIQIGIGFNNFWIESPEEALVN